MHLIPSEFRIGGVYQASTNLDEPRHHPKDMEQQVKAVEVALAQSVSQIEQAESAVKSTTTELESVRADFVRAAKLVKEGNIAKRAYVHTKASYDVAQADDDKSQAQLIQAKSGRSGASAG